MPNVSKAIKLDTRSKNKLLCLDNIDYLGSGAYRCDLYVNSNGFIYDRKFGFDNDEYFLGKARELLATRSGLAELMGLAVDSFIKLQPFGDDTILVTGLIIEEEELTQSLEFAFTTDYKTVEQFIKEFEQMVKANT